ncbi:ATP-grasp domain-containing protein [Cytobacillus sp. FJAT-54145]|uniref:ATP-grasp domain-containing protein n=1 Tax=Cytobacillus spartinae TaxID=3299023 RepID=A0ABW6KCY5_9BACI
MSTNETGLTGKTIKTVLLTGGRAPVTLDLARYFSAAGYHIYVADSFPQSLCKASNCIKGFFTITSPVENYDRFLADLKGIILKQKINLLIPTCEEVLYIAKGKEELSNLCHVFCSELPFLLSLHNKYTFIKSASDKGLQVPTTYLVKNKEELTQALQLVGAAVMKPVYSRFASKVIYSDSQHVKEVPVSSKVPYVVQERITGRFLCSYSVIHQGSIKAHVVYDANYTAGNGASILFKSVDHEGIRNWVTNYFEDSNAEGQFSFDFIEKEDGQIYPIECNPRATSGVHLFNGKSLPSAIVEAKEENPDSQKREMIGLAMLIYGWQKKNKRQWLKDFFHSKDVVWSKKDSMPFLYQFRSYFSILRLSRKLNVTPLEASTHDIEWNGEDE